MTKLFNPFISLLAKLGAPLAARMARRARQSLPLPNLEGDRDIEWSWVCAHLGNGPGEALDFGCGSSPLSLTAARRGYNVTAIDLQPVDWPYSLPNMRFVRGDITSYPFPEASFDLIINSSSIEHVGLPGRYGSADNPEGDIAAMSRMSRLLKPGGAMLLTAPVGRDAVFAPHHRVYGRERLSGLLEHWTVAEKEFWVKDDRNRWVAVEEAAALDGQPTRFYYGLGCFVLRPAPR